MALLDEIRNLGYTVSPAHGQLQPELDALDRARTEASPEQVSDDAAPIIAHAQQFALEQMRNDPRYTDDDRALICARLQTQTLRMLQEQRDARVVHQDAAVEIARELPDVWHVEGHGVSLYVAANPDTGEGWSDDDNAVLAALADTEAHAERAAQHASPGDDDQ